MACVFYLLVWFILLGLLVMFVSFSLVTYFNSPCIPQGWCRKKSSRALGLLF
ncbi:hypothetical protein PIIN_10269 [Serendipita indica DSM 11827]|uniref:Uncharacterized protein n=1 Tax=Serendipita indica (strain DSM 11827) TaxID=1109443 RepID=G4TY81_SERID|nr:hypothetical protein PIIN_10269 [Serendipita indica DSM 11827]